MKKYNLTSHGLHSLRLNAEYRKCIRCGKFINFETDDYRWYDPTHVYDLEPRDPVPYHVDCKVRKKS